MSGNQHASNGTNTRGPGRGRYASNGQYGHNPVHPDHVDNDAFTFELADAVQCVLGERYSLSENCAERDYFTECCVEALLGANSYGVTAPKPPLFLKMVQTAVNDPSSISIIDFKCGHLRLVENPDLTTRESGKDDPTYVPEVWENYMSGTKHMVQAPVCAGGRHYEVLNQRSWPWKVKITARVKMDYLAPPVYDQDVDYAMCVEMAKRGKHHIYYSGGTKDDYCTSLQIGEINESTQNFVPWDMGNRLNALMIDDATLLHKTFYQKNAHGPHWPMSPEVAPEVTEPAPIIRQKWNLVAQDGYMGYFNKEKGSDEWEWVAVCSFELVDVLANYQFVEDDCGDPFTKILCRVLVNQGDRTCLLKSDDIDRSPNLDGVKWLEVEVLVQIGYIQRHSDLKATFQKYCSLLLVTLMTPDMLACWISENNKMCLERCIVRFGRQLDGTFVSGNIWFNGEMILDHESAHYCVVPAHFKASLLPIPKPEYPRNIIIPQCHVRYVIGMRFWSDLMPRFFANNLMPAKAVFAQYVMGLYASKIWDSQCGFGKGMPFAWCYSAEPNTGKTEALLAGNAMLGFFSRSPFAGDATKAALFERLSQQADLTIAVDDVVVISHAI